MTLTTVLNVLIKVWIASEVGLLLFMHTRGKSNGARDRGSLLLLWPTIVAAIVCGGWFGGTHPHTILHGAHWLLIVALVLVIAGLVIRWTAIISLGRSFSVNVAIHSDQHVMKSGLFRVVRHPSYSGMLLLLLAMGLLTRNWVALAITVVPPALALLYRLHVEESALREAFGQEYVEYSASTRRLIPGLY